MALLVLLPRSGNVHVGSMCTAVRLQGVQNIVMSYDETNAACSDGAREHGPRAGTFAVGLQCRAMERTAGVVSKQSDAASLLCLSYQ